MKCNIFTSVTSQACFIARRSTRARTLVAFHRARNDVVRRRSWGRPVLGDPPAQDCSAPRSVRGSTARSTDAPTCLPSLYAFLLKGERCGVAAPRITAPHYSSRTRKPRTYECAYGRAPRSVRPNALGALLLSPRVSHCNRISIR